MSYVVRLILVLLLLTGSLWAFSSNTYLSWVKPSYVEALWQKDNDYSYSFLEKFDCVSVGSIDGIVQTTRRHGGALAITVKEYIQPGGLPGFNYMHIYTDEGKLDLIRVLSAIHLELIIEARLVV